MFERKKFGEIVRWGPKDVEKPRELTPLEKIAHDALRKSLAEKAEVRQEKCWRCDKKASVWVQMVGFDNKGEKAAPLVHCQIVANDYPGPVPGFCRWCVPFAHELAQAVYHDRPEIRWGARPTRWQIALTDGSVIMGECTRLRPDNLPKILSTHAVSASVDADNPPQ